eukprot:37743-Prymnesium_polylepis.1
MAASTCTESVASQFGTPGRTSVVSGARPAYNNSILLGSRNPDRIPARPGVAVVVSSVADNRGIQLKIMHFA